MIQPKCHAIVCGIIFITMVSKLVAEETRFDVDPIQKRIQKQIDLEQIPSLAVAVVSNGDIIWEKGFGWADKARRIPATEHTMYSLASISKPITATGIMKLVENGQLDLDRPVNDYLVASKLIARVGNVQEATIRRLLNHSSGLAVHYQFFYEDQPFSPPLRDETIRRYGVLVSEPGSIYQYANLGYGVLDHVLSLVSGKTYADFMRSEVFLPLGMRHSSVYVDGRLESTVAVRYGNDQLPIPLYLFDHDGASAVYSSAHDLSLFALLHLNTIRDDQIAPVNAQHVLAMQRATIPIDQRSGYGIGWRITENQGGYRIVSHTGGMPGVRTSLTMVPDERIAVIALANTETNLPHEIVDQVLEVLLKGNGASGLSNHRTDAPKTFKKPLVVNDLHGHWKGEVETFEGNRSFELWIDSEGKIRVQLDGQLENPVVNANIQQGWLKGEFISDLRTTDTYRAPYRLQLNLKVDAEHMTGSLSAVSIYGSRTETQGKLPSRSHFALSHFTYLRRQDNLSQVRAPDEVKDNPVFLRQEPHYDVIRGSR